MVSERPQSLREDGLEWEVASGWPEMATKCGAGTKPTLLGQEAEIPDRATPKFSFFRDHWLSSLRKTIPFYLRYLVSGQGVFSVWAGRICRKICIPIQPDWPDTLPQSREFTLLSNRRVQVIALMMGGSTCSSLWPCPCASPLLPAEDLL